MANIFFDLDGTIVNSQGRLYQIFCELCPENKFSYDEYWEIKRTRVTQKEFLQKYFAYSDDKIADFHKKYLAKVEENKYINTDFKVKGIEAVLRKLCQRNCLYVVTNRQNTDKTIAQIDALGWNGLFKKVLVTNQKTTKAELIESEVGVSAEDIFISDSGEDIKTAKKLGIKSVAVTWGILNRDILAAYQPDMIFDEVDDFDRLEIRN